jgi:predicted RNA-binding Zn ribbon-like protein
MTTSSGVGPKAPAGLPGAARAGGPPCLDFVNTVDGRLGGAISDSLTSYDDLLTWSAGAGVITNGEAERLRALAAADPVAGRAALDRARVFREALWRILRAHTAGAAPAAADVAAPNAAVAGALAHARLQPGADGFAWGWEEAATLDRPLWTLARAAGDLLTGPELARVRRCGSATCASMFLDTSRNGSRRWCDMETCGNRAKARRHYSRARGAAA